MQLANLLCGTEQAFQSALVMKYLQKFFEQLFEKGINTIIWYLSDTVARRHFCLVAGV